MALEGLGLRVRGSGSGVKLISKSDAIGGKLSMIDTTPISWACQQTSTWEAMHVLGTRLGCC